MRSTRKAAPVVIAAALLLAWLWVGGCGKEVPPQERLRAAADAAREAGSAHTQVMVAVSPREGERGTSVNAQGDVWVDMNAGKLEARLTALGMELSLRYLEGKAFLRFGGQWYVLEGEIAEGIDEEAVGALAGLLRAAPEIVASAEEVEKTGEKKVGDYDCDIFSVKPDLEAIAALPAVREMGAALGLSEDEVVRYLEEAGPVIEVCVQKDEDVIRRIAVSADIDLAGMGEVAGIPLLPEKARLEISIDFPAYGVEVDVQPPADAKPFSGLF